MGWATVEIDLGDIDTSDLIDELEGRGFTVVGEDGVIGSVDIEIRKLADKMKLNQSIQEDIKEIIYKRTGMIV